MFLIFVGLQELAVAEGNKQEKQCLWRCGATALRFRTTCADRGKLTRNRLEMSLGRLVVVGPDILDVAFLLVLKRVCDFEL